MDSSGPETALRERFLDLLEDHIALAEHDPQVNPVKLLAYDISRELEDGEISNGISNHCRQCPER
jgi:hypothetical protein